MGTIETLGKWNLETSTWIKSVKNEDRGRSSAIGTYEDIITTPNEPIHYILIALGSRVEDHSRDFFNIKETEISVNKFISYFSNKNKNVAIRTFLMDADAPIREDAKIISQYIDNLSKQDQIASINLLGVSKCGTMSFYVPKYFERLSSFTKTNIFTIASPWDGTKMASPKIFYPEVKRLIKSKFGNTKLADTIYNGLISIYEGVSSNSHMDYDIAIQNGVPKEKEHVYDETFIKNIFNDDNKSAIQRINSYHNLITGIDEKTIKEAILTGNVTGIGLCILHELFFEEQSDGLVKTSSQHLVEEHIPKEKIKTHHLYSTHHSVIGTDRALNDIMFVVNDTIDEQVDKAKVLQKH